MKLKGNKLLITGSTSGIGEAILEAFIKEDNQVIAVGRNEEKLKDLAAKDKRIIPFRCDVSKQEDLDSLVVFIEQDHTDLNILINNAGIQYNFHSKPQEVNPVLESNDNHEHILSLAREKWFH